MSLEVLTIIGVGVALGGLIASLGSLVLTRLKGIDERLSRLEGAVADLRERMAKLAGFMEGLKAAIAQRKPA